MQTFIFSFRVIAYGRCQTGRIEARSAEHALFLARALGCVDKFCSPKMTLLKNQATARKKFFIKLEGV